MKYLELQKKIKDNVFTLLHVLRHFPQEKQETVKIQLSRWIKKGLIYKIKRGIYCFDPSLLDEFELAGRLYQPSYISLETALNYYGIIPDIPQEVTSVTPTTTKKIKTPFGRFSYAKIEPKLFFGFKKVKSTKGGFFEIAFKEKALLDYFYLRKIKKTAGLRLSLKDLDFTLYQKFLLSYPSWVAEIAL